MSAYNKNISICQNLYIISGSGQELRIGKDTTFNYGLDLEYANIEKEMNFFGIRNLDHKKSKDKTLQETYRIVKYQLEKVGNIIDANKYTALELSKKRITSCEDCESFYSLLDCIVLYCIVLYCIVSS